MAIPRRTRGCSPWALMGCGCGLIAGIGILLIFILLGVQMMRARVDPSWDRASYAQCIVNLKTMKVATEKYRQDFGHLPAQLADLQPRYIDAKQLHCPLESENGEAYLYTPNTKRPTDSIITCKNHGQGTLMLRLNGQIRLPSLRKHQR